MNSIEIVKYGDGELSGGGAVDEAAKAHMNRTGMKSYGEAVKAVIETARAEVDEDVKEFRSRTRAYQAQWHLSEAEAVRRVAQHDPKMKAVYEADPMGPILVTGIQPPPAKADITVKPWEPPIHEPIAIIQIANILFGLPKDEFGFIELGQAREALRNYPDLLQKAASEKLDAYTRAEMNIAGSPGFGSENYPTAFNAALRRFPSLSALYSVGRLSSQALRELLPQIQISD